MATLKTGTTIAGQTAWHTGNDGTGSTLDADTVDGFQATGLSPSQATTAAPTVRGVGDIWVDSDSVPYTWDAYWQYPTLVNGWVNYSGAPGDWGPARYRRVFGGLVIMEGLVRSGSGAILNIPVGYRPQYNFLTSTIANPNVGARIEVNTNGYVYPSFVSPGDAGFYSLCCWWYA